MAYLQPQPLVFPRGVRFPRDDEFPAGHESERERIRRANVTTGFVLRDHHSQSFAAYFEANVNAPSLFEVFRGLSMAILPDVAAPIIGVKEDDPFLGPYTERDDALRVFEPHVQALQHDGFLEFGVIFQHHGQTEEVFVRSSKYLQVWTNNPDTVRGVFNGHGIPELETLEFIDEFPMVSESLLTSDGNASWPHVVESLRLAFDRLPRRDPP